MIKPVAKFNINKVFNISSLLRHKKDVNQLPKLDKPIVAYMSGMFLEPERDDFTNSLLGITKTFYNLYTSLTENEKCTETKTEVKTETKTETIAEVKTEKKEVTKEKIKKKEQRQTTNFMPKVKYYDYEEPRIIKKTNNIKKIFVDSKNVVLNILHRTKKEITKFIFYVPNKIENIKRQKAHKKRMEMQKIEHQKAIATRQEKLEQSRARTQFIQLRKRYFSMFAADDVVPKVPEFKNYNSLNSNELKILISVITACIEHQKIINAKKNKFRIGSKNYSNDKNREELNSTLLQEIKPNLIPDNNKRRQNFKKELIRLHKIYIENSKIVEKPIGAFNNITKTFFDKTKNSLQEIYDVKKKWYYRYLEKIPKFGLIPKTVRVTGQINLTRCIMKDYRDVTDRYAKSGLAPVMKKYSQQADFIKKFVDNNRYYLEKNDIAFAEQTLQRIEDVKTQRVNTYKKLFDLFAKGGCNISNICTNIRLREGVGLLKKAAVTFLSIF